MRRWMSALFVMLLLGTSTAWAGSWEQTGEDGWKYEEDGAYVTDWKQIDGIWYYMDTETGQWNPRPALSETAACCLLENAVKRAGWYAKETFPIHYKIDSKTSNTYTIVLLMETAPTEWSETLNTFEVNRKTGKAKSLSTKLELDLYEY